MRNLASFPSAHCWGDKGSRGLVGIFIGSDTLSITASLEIALRALQKKHGFMLLWIDQICINQQDSKEKSY